MVSDPEVRELPRYMTRKRDAIVCLASTVCAAVFGGAFEAAYAAYDLVTGAYSHDAALRLGVTSVLWAACTGTAAFLADRYMERRFARAHVHAIAERIADGAPTAAVAEAMDLRESNVVYSLSQQADQIRRAQQARCAEELRDKQVRQHASLIRMNPHLLNTKAGN